MSVITLFLFSENSREPKVIEIDDEALIREIIIKECHPIGGHDHPEEIMIFTEDGDEPHDHSHPIKHHFKHHHRIHAHRCRKVKVDLVYNRQVSIELSPAVSGQGIVDLLPKLFGITEKEANTLQLELAPNVFMSRTDHIGQFVKHGDCRHKITLFVKKNVQG